MRKSIAAAVIAASAATSACGRTHAEDGGPTVSRNYQVGSFDQIEVAGPYNVQVRTGANPSVTAQGSQKLIEHWLSKCATGSSKSIPSGRRAGSTPAGISTARST